jgi:hypothetical protein
VEEPLKQTGKGTTHHGCREGHHKIASTHAESIVTPNICRISLMFI